MELANLFISFTTRNFDVARGQVRALEGDTKRAGEAMSRNLGGGFGRAFRGVASLAGRFGEFRVRPQGAPPSGQPGAGNPAGTAAAAAASAAALAATRAAGQPGRVGAPAGRPGNPLPPSAHSDSGMASILAELQAARRPLVGMQRVFRQVGGELSGGMNLAGDMMRRAVASKMEPALLKLQQRMVQNVAAIRGWSPVQTAMVQRLVQWHNALGKVQDRLGRVRDALAPITSMATLAFGGLTAAIGGAVAVASPDTWSTLTGSFKLLSMSIGSAFLPYVIKLSAALQYAAFWVRNLDKGTKDGIASWVVWGLGIAGAVMVVPRVVAAISGLISVFSALGKVMFMAGGVGFTPLAAGLTVAAAAALLLANNLNKVADAMDDYIKRQKGLNEFKKDEIEDDEEVKKAKAIKDPAERQSFIQLQKDQAAAKMLLAQKELGLASKIQASLPGKVLGQFPESVQKVAIGAGLYWNKQFGLIPGETAGNHPSGPGNIPDDKLTMPPAQWAREAKEKALAAERDFQKWRFVMDQENAKKQGVKPPPFKKPGTGEDGKGNGFQFQIDQNHPSIGQHSSILDAMKRFQSAALKSGLQQEIGQQQLKELQNLYDQAKQINDQIKQLGLWKFLTG